MSITIYLETESFYNIGNDLTLYDRIDEVQTIVNRVKEMGDKIKKHDSIYECVFYANKAIGEWLYDTSDRNHALEKRMLSRIIDRTESVEDIEYQNIKMQVETMNLLSHIALLCFSPTGDSDLYIKDTKDLIKLHRFYLKEYHDITKFINEAKICFPRLYFHEGVKESVKTLSSSFSDYIHEIIRHLGALNDEFVELFSENRNNLREALRLFASKSDLECTLEGNRESARARFTFQFQNHNQKIVDLVCEPHTKLESTGKKGDSKYRFDRIYFHQGNSEVEDGKVLVAHIGKHL